MALLTKTTMVWNCFATFFPMNRRCLHHHPARRKLHRALSSSSSFEPQVPPPPFLGQAVFPDINITVKSRHAIQRNEDPDAIFVVTGAGRSMGLQFVMSLLHRTAGTVVACCRDPNNSPHLQEFLLSESSQRRSRVQVVKLDIERQDQIDGLRDQMGALYGPQPRVDGLFNVAGILGDAVHTPGPERSMSRLEREWVDKSLAVNLVGPVMLAKALTPLMKNRKSSTPTRAKTVVVNMSARVGSISDNQLGGWYSYRFSKAALNQATRTMAHELKRQGTWAIALHPGTTDTDLSKPFQKNVKKGKLFPVDFTVERMLDIVDAMEEEHSGGFYDWAGKALSF